MQKLASLEIRHLKLIKTVAEEGSLTKAIEKLCLTQSALSHQLKEIESKIGAPVFHRINKKLVLTEIGKRLLGSAEVILSELNSAEKEIENLINGESGSIRISTECYTCYHWLPSLMKQFNKKYPNVEVTIVTEATHKPIEKMLAGKLDISITCDPIEDSNIEYVDLFKDELVAIFPPDHSWAKKRFLIAEDFKDENLIIHSKPLESVTVIQKVLVPAGVKPKKIIPMPLTEACVEMVKAGMGVSTMASWAFKPYNQSNELAFLPITKRGLFRTWQAAILKKSIYPPYFLTFIDFLRERMEVKC